MWICPPGQKLDPRTGCGECVPAAELNAEIYPVWATPEDMDLAELEGLTKQFEDTRTRYKVCPFKLGDKKHWCEEG